MQPAVPLVGETAREREEHGADRRKVLERKALSAASVAETLRLEGRTELDRAWLALALSGFGSGLSIGLSFLGEGVLHGHLPNAEWRPLLTSFGYTLGFLVVTLGRQQLYTETTLTALLPALHGRTSRLFASAMRLWAVVLVANLIGAAMFAWAAAASPAFSPELHGAFRELGHQALRNEPWSAFVKGIFGGWLIALMVWLLPSAHTARIWIIVALTYVLSAAQLTHIIAGSVDAFYLMAVGELSFIDYAWRYGVPVLVGNTIGGVVLVTALNWFQVASE